MKSFQEQSGCSYFGGNAEFEHAWQEVRTRSDQRKRSEALFRKNRDRQSEPSFESVEALLALHRFRAFRNGGRPLFERRSEEWQFEILVRWNTARFSDNYLPYTVDLHVSNLRLAELRARYAGPRGLGGPHVATVNIASINSPGRKAIFNGANPRAVSELYDLLGNDGLPWFEQASSPFRWGMLGYSPLKPLATLELLLIYHGWGTAGRFLLHFMDRNEPQAEQIRSEFKRLERGGYDHDTHHCQISGLAMVASRFALL